MLGSKYNNYTAASGSVNPASAAYDAAFAPPAGASEYESFLNSGGDLRSPNEGSV